MTHPRIYLDLDGAMADFDAHFPAMFGVDHKQMLDDDMWGQINSHPSYFLDMPVCPGALKFFKSIEALNPIILTACPKSNYAHAARQKREWVREHLGTHVHVLPVMGGRHKPLFMHAAASPAGTGAGTLADRDGRSEGEAALVGLPTHFFDDCGSGA